MQAKNEILEELRMLSAHILPGIRQTPYRAPEGYFDELSAQVLRRLPPLSNDEVSSAVDHTEASEWSTDMPKSLTFSVPEGYFDNFAQSLLTKIKATQASANNSNEQAGQPETAAAETGQLSPIVNGISRSMPYRIPSDYFQEQSPILTVARQFQPYSLPEEYFSGISPILVVARSLTSYTVPEQYFEQLPQEINDQAAAISAFTQTTGTTAVPDTVTATPDTAEKAATRRGDTASAASRSSANVVRLSTARPARGWLRYAAAAAMAGVVLTIGAVQWNAGNNTTNVTTAAVDIASSLHTASDSDMQSYLDDQNNDLLNTQAEAITNNTNEVEIDDNAVKSILGDVSDGELKQYIEEHGSNDIATN